MLYLGAMIGLLTLTPTVPLDADRIESFKLKNGMEFLVLEDHSIPHISLYLFWKVGSRNEVPGITGLSHFFEHMMFNGSKNYAPGEFDRVMEGVGGSNNAFTSENVTAYQNWFPSDALETIFQLEADRIANLDFDPDVIESERGVVQSERMTYLENSNFFFLYEPVKLTAFAAHPYRWPIIGYASDIEAWTKEDLVTYHRTYYAPNNGLAVLVGDVTVETARAMAEKYIAPIPSQDPPRPIRTQEPRQLGEKRIQVCKHVQMPHLMMAYHVPATDSPDFLPLTLLSHILTTGNTSRLVKGLVEERQMAASISSHLSPSFDPFLCLIHAVGAEQDGLEPLEQAIDGILKQIVDEGVSQRELDKAKNFEKMSFYRKMTTNSGRAQALGMAHLFLGHYGKLFGKDVALDGVTLHDIQRVAAAYLVDSNRTVGYLTSPIPTKTEAIP